MGGKRRNSEFGLEDLVRFERFISGKNGDYTYEELVASLTCGRLDALMEGAPEERKSLLAGYYEASLNDPERLGWIITDVYNQVFDGTLKRFPDGIYNGYQGKLNFKFMLRYGIKVNMKWKKEEVPQKISKNEIRSLRLGRGLDRCFNDTPSRAAMFSYPEMNLKPWYFCRNEENIWFNEDGSVNYRMTTEAVREFVSAWLSKRTDEEVAEALKSEKGTALEGMRVDEKPASLLTRIVQKDFEKPLLAFGSNLGHMINVCFSDCPYAAITSAYPEIPFKPHYFTSAPDNYWINKDKSPNMENISEATKEFFAIWLKARPAEALGEIKHRDFTLPLFPGGSSLYGMLQSCLKNCAFETYADLLEAVYPGKLKAVQYGESGKRKRVAYIGNAK